jgi:hypothetical protein
MTSYDDFLPYVLPDVPGCAEIVAIQAIRNTAIDFCEKTMVVETDLDPVSLVVGVTDYDLEPPAAHLVTKIVRLFYRNRELKPVARDDINVASFYNPDAIDKEQPGQPQRWTQKDTKTITVWPEPKESEAGALTIRAALKPTRASTSCDDILFEDYAEYIAAGAKARLMLVPNKAYTNPNLVVTQNQLYMQGVNMARQRAARGHTRANMRVKQVRI